MIQLDVVAGILIDDSHRVLICERIEAGPFCGLWEFPGGKIDPGESALAALHRELAEELGIESGRSVAFMELHHAYPDRAVSLQFFRVLDWRGEPQGLEGQDVRWLAPAEIEVDQMLPADAPVIDALLAAVA